MLNKTDHIKVASTVLAATLAISACKESENKSESPKPTEPEITQEVSLSENQTEPPTPTETDISQPAPEQPPQQMDPTVGMIENPQYTSWAKFGIGTKITLENNTHSQGVTQTATITQTLTDINPDSLAYEVSIKTNFNGQDIETPSQKQTVPAKVPAGTPTRPSEVPGVNIIEERQEVITIGDRDYNTRVTKFEMQGGEAPNNFTSTTTVWESEEVPGLLVRMDSTTTFTEMTSNTSLRLIEIEAK